MVPPIWVHERESLQSSTVFSCGVSDLWKLMPQTLLKNANLGCKDDDEEIKISERNMKNQLLQDTCREHKDATNICITQISILVYEPSGDTASNIPTRVCLPVCPPRHTTHARMSRMRCIVHREEGGLTDVQTQSWAGGGMCEKSSD